VNEPNEHKPGCEPGCEHDHSAGRARVRIDAPEGTDPLLLAQVVLGRQWLVKAERRESDNPFEVHKPLGEMYDLAVGEYRAQYTRMLARIDRYVARHTTLTKATRQRALFTVTQLQELAQIIRDHHTAIAIGFFGETSVPPAEVQRLVAMNILPKAALGIIDDAFAYGQLLAAINAQVERGVTRIPEMTLTNIKKRLKSRPLPLTTGEEMAREWARQSAATHVRGLGNRVAHDFETTAIEADRALQQRMQNAIRETLDANIERAETWRKLKSDLGHKTDDWARDFGRIAATEKTRAMQEGQVQALVKREGDPKHVLVAKIPTPAACDHCVRLHLTSGVGSRPRVFRLADLQSNGSNVGRKAREWKAVVGPTHPWCECALVHVPEGWGFDSTGNLVPKRARKSWTLDHDLSKALSYGDSVPEALTVRVGDPERLAVIDDVIARTPKTLFTRKTGVTLITTDHPTQNSHLDDHDFAYWTGNEIRLMQNLPLEKLRAVLEHEIGHTPNVYLFHRFGSIAKVRAWHEHLFKIGNEEGHVSDYASKLAIECAAEVTRMYLYDRANLMLNFPRQFTWVHRYYKPLIRRVSQRTMPNPAATQLLPKQARLDQ